jgi:hypothetical protein
MYLSYYQCIIWKIHKWDLFEAQITNPNEFPIFGASPVGGRTRKKWRIAQALTTYDAGYRIEPELGSMYSVKKFVLYRARVANLLWVFIIPFWPESYANPISTHSALVTVRWPLIEPCQDRVSYNHVSYIWKDRKVRSFI